jgi:hypothetical protein
MDKLLIRCVCVFLLATGVTLWAQSVGGTLSGRITSADGSPVANAAITVTNTQTNTSQKALTGADGAFSIVALPPAIYRVDVESVGYKRTSQQNIELTSTGPVTVNITLEAGNTNETVEIKGTAPMTQTDNGEVSVGQDTRVVHEVPLVDRNHQDLVQFEAGISPPIPALDFAVDPDRNRFYSTNGQFPFLNQNYLDGVLNQEPYRDTAIRVIPEEMIQQFNISTANLSMDKGFTNGAYVTDNSRGGTNSLHGDLFEFFSANPLRTRSYFDTIDNNAPRFIYNQFGVTAGGPIVTDKLFFFGSWEGSYDRGDNTQISTVPIPSTLTGNFSSIPGLTLYNPFFGSSDGTVRGAFLGNVLPGSLVNPTAAAIASYLPAPNLPGLANNYLSNTPYQLDYQKFDGRIDYHMSDRTSAFFRYGYSNNHALENSPLGTVIADGMHDRIVADNAVIALDHAFGDNLITDFKFGYNRYDANLGLYSNTSPLASTLGLSGLGAGLIEINIPGMPLMGSPAGLPENPIDNTFNWVWNWGWHTAKHSFKWGVDVRRIRADGWLDNPYTTLYGANGTAYFGPGPTLLNNGSPLTPYSQLYNSFASFLLGAPSQVGTVDYLTNPSIRQSQYGVWLGDNIHVLHRVTLDLGVRYEIFGPLRPANPGGAEYYDSATNTFNYSGIDGVGATPTITQTRNIAPRIGVAFNLNDRTVIRGGYAIQYFQMPYMLSGFLAPETGAVAGVAGTYAVAPFTGVFGPTLTGITLSPTSVTNGAYAGNLPATVIPRNLPTPYVQTFSLQIQRDFYYGSVLSIGYVGMLDRHLPGNYNLNYALPGTGVAGLPLGALGETSPVTYFQNGMNANYNALQINLNKRFSQGIAFMAAYTYSKALGYTTSNGQLLDPLNLGMNYGPMGYDRQQMLNITHLWDIPWGRQGNNIFSSILGGWQLNGVLNWYTGEPLTFTADPLLCNCPGLPVLAGAYGTGSSLITGNYGNGQSYFNNAAFYAPIDGNSANLSRGVLRGPDSWTYNLALLKNFRFYDRFNFQIRGEAYNLANTVRPFNPITNINSPAFGQISTLFPSAVPGAFGREVKFGAAVQF